MLIYLKTFSFIIPKILSQRSIPSENPLKLEYLLQLLFQILKVLIEYLHINCITFYSGYVSVLQTRKT